MEGLHSSIKNLGNIWSNLELTKKYMLKGFYDDYHFARSFAFTSIESQCMKTTWRGTKSKRQWWMLYLQDIVFFLCLSCNFSWIVHPAMSCYPLPLLYVSHFFSSSPSSMFKRGNIAKWNFFPFLKNQKLNFEKNWVQNFQTYSQYFENWASYINFDEPSRAKYQFL